MNSPTADAEERAVALLAGLADESPVSGWTHKFYRYPARFSPAFAKAAITTLTEPGDLVLDPFCGGGTTLVEAVVAGRPALGTDVSSLATFISRVKSTPLVSRDLEVIAKWTVDAEVSLNLWQPGKTSSDTAVPGWQSLGRTESWRTRKLIDLGLASLARVENARAEAFIRCALLSTAQWALDSRKRIPSAEEFRNRLSGDVKAMTTGIERLGKAVRQQRAQRSGPVPLRSWCITTDAAKLPDDRLVARLPAPRLILTSPPYPGVHVLYHRWQILGRRETAAPFWIANQPDGHGPSHYTFAHRTNADAYFQRTRATFRSLAAISDRNTLLVQLVGFADPSLQLDPFLSAMDEAGFVEAPLTPSRPWRAVPNRRWHADQKGLTGASTEVVLVHRLKAGPAGSLTLHS